MIGVVVLPSVKCESELVTGFSCQGDYTGEELVFITLVLPSLNRVGFVNVFFLGVY